MKSPIQPSNFDVSNLPFAVGASAFARGTAYAQQGRVLRMQWSSGDFALHGAVVGRGGFYQTTARFDPDRPPYPFVGGECSCPMEFDCKHVVALVLAATGAQAPRAPREHESWEDALSGLLRARDPEHEPHDGTPLALQLSISEDATGHRHLRAKLARPGKTGWVNGNLSWPQLSVAYYMSGYNAAHVRLVQELYAVFSARSSYPAQYYGTSKAIDLTEFESRNLWSLLDEARDVGITIVHGHKSLGEVAPHGDADFSLDITRNPDSGSLSVQPVIRVDGGGAVTPLAFVGSEAHGIAYTEAKRPGDVTRRRINLAKLRQTVPKKLQAMALQDRPLVIPADAADRFVEQYYLHLRRIAPITSSDDSFRPPDVSAPSLALNANYEPDHRVDLNLEWAYRIGDTEVRTPLGPPAADAPYRDVDREQELISDLLSPLAGLGLDPLTDDRPASPRSDLRGLDTLRFTTEILPLLRDHPDVEVAVHGDPLDYREVTDTLTIGITADEGADADWFDLGISVSVDGHEIPLAVLIKALSEGESHLLLSDGAFISLDKPELHNLRTLLEEARALQDRPGGLKISRYQAGLWEELVSLGVVRRQADAWRRQVDDLVNLRSLPPAPVPSSLRAELRPYQRDGFQWLAFLWQHQLGGILADDMGLGKTVQTLALMCHAKATSPEVPPFLIVAPTSVVPNWAAEAARFAPDLRVVTVTETHRRRGSSLAEVARDADVIVTSYTIFRLDFDHDYATEQWSGLVLDEAQQVKNHQAKAHQAARKLATPFKLAITGTPMENNLMELWALLSIAAPGLFPSPTRFKELYARPIENGHNPELLAQLRQRIKPLMTRRTKEQVAADLPAKQEQVLEVELHSKHRTVYDRYLHRERQKILGLVDDLDKNRFTILRSLTVLRQLSLHAGLVDDQHVALPSAKIDLLLEQLQDVVASGHRALIFSQFTGFLGAVRTALDMARIDYEYLDGKTRNRGDVIDEFKNGTAPVFLISLKAGGFGLNLTEADYCFILDPWWNPATEAQAIDRTHRIGQTRNVMVYRLISKNTIEEKVMALKQRKAELFSTVMDGGNAFGTTVTADDIRGLFS